MTRYRRSGEDWRDYAACRQEDPDLFFPIGNTATAKKQTEEAKSVCKRCPAIGHCALYALERGEDAGVWGGMSEDERMAFKRRQARRGDSAEQLGQDLYEAFLQQRPQYFQDNGLPQLEPVIVPIEEVEASAAEQSNQNQRV